MAQIYFGISSLTVPVGSTFEVGVFLDSQGEALAAAESLLKFSSNVELVDIRDGNSVVSLWLERPRSLETTISFAGAIPGGFRGDRGQLFTLVFKAEDQGQFTIESQDAQLLLSDGQGTLAAVVPAPLELVIVSEGEPVAYEVTADTEPPVAFTPMLVEQADLGGWAVVFSTQDKGSGLDYYEVKEGLWGWQRAESPHLLQDQDLRHNISVKAVDREGNEQIATLAAPNGHVWYESWQFWSILLVALLMLVGAVYALRLWGKKRSPGYSK